MLRVPVHYMIPKPPPKAPRVDQQTRREYRAKLSAWTGPKPDLHKRPNAYKYVFPAIRLGRPPLKAPSSGQRLPKRISRKTQRFNRRFFAVSPAQSAVSAFRILLKKTGLNRSFCELVAPGRASTICCAFQKGTRYACPIKGRPARSYYE